MASTKPKKKIVFDPLKGEFDLITDNNFSYKDIGENQTVKVRSNEQKAVFGCFDVEGTLDLEGDLIIEE